MARFMLFATARMAQTAFIATARQRFRPKLIYLVITG